MVRTFSRCWLVGVSTFAWGLFAVSAEDGEGKLVQVRAVLLDPARPLAELYMHTKSGGLERLQLLVGSLSPPLEVIPQEGFLMLYRTADIDPADPPPGAVVASARLPQNSDRLMAIIVPGGQGAERPYQIVLVNNSLEAFPQGESRIVSFLSEEIAVQIGEHRIQVPGGRITRVPAVRQRSDFNMAQTNFYSRHGGRWMPFTERQTQYLDEYRRLFLVHVVPGASHPSVMTILDVAPAVLPGE